MKLRHIKNGVLILGISTALAWGGAASAQTGDALLNKLVDKGVLTQREANQLREDMDKEAAQTVEKYNKTKVASWIDQMKWSGDLRLRAESFNYENQLPLGSNGKPQVPNPDRLRYRARLRLGVEAALENWADVGLRIGTGDPGDPYNGLSQNTTFTDTFRKKPINLDLAYVTVHPPSLDWLKITGGKMLMPMWHPVTLSPMIYDPDLTPEGLAEQVSFKFGDKNQYRLFGNFGQFSVKEFSADENDAYMFDLQGGIEAKFEKVKITVAAGYYMTENLQNVAAEPSPGKNLLQGDFPGNTFTGDSGNKGNSVGPKQIKTVTLGSLVLTNSFNNYPGNFNVVYGMGEVAYTISEKPFLGTPCVLTLGGEYMKNLSSVFVHDPIDNQTEAYGLQAVFGSAQKKGQWMFGYEYKYLEANSTLDSIVDDDFGPYGGTDRKGHIFNVQYCPKDWWVLGFKAYATEKIDGKRLVGATTHGQPGLPGQDTLRLQFDTTFKF
jgi:polyhydroxyalkanoate synthesis regulator phasin